MLIVEGEPLREMSLKEFERKVASHIGEPLIIERRTPRTSNFYDPTAEYAQLYVEMGIIKSPMIVGQKVNFSRNPLYFFNHDVYVPINDLRVLQGRNTFLFRNLFSQETTSPNDFLGLHSFQDFAEPGEENREEHGVPFYLLGKEELVRVVRTNPIASGNLTEKELQHFLEKGILPS
jgi:hypothetical protein